MLESSKDMAHFMDMSFCHGCRNVLGFTTYLVLLGMFQELKTKWLCVVFYLFSRVNSIYTHF